MHPQQYLCSLPQQAASRPHCAHWCSLPCCHSSNVSPLYCHTQPQLLPGRAGRNFHGILSTSHSGRSFPSLAGRIGRAPDPCRCRPLCNCSMRVWSCCSQRRPSDSTAQGRCDCRVCTENERCRHSDEMWCGFHSDSRSHSLWPKCKSCPPCNETVKEWYFTQSCNNLW